MPMNAVVKFEINNLYSITFHYLSVEFSFIRIRKQQESIKEG